MSRWPLIFHPFLLLLLLFSAELASSQGVVWEDVDNRDGSDDDRDNRCRVAHCSRCFNPFTCDDCDPGYFVASSRRDVCAPCSYGCAECDSSTACTRCFDGFGLLKSEACEECAIKGCARCDGDVKSCKACRWYLRLSPDTKECVTNRSLLAGLSCLVTSLLAAWARFRGRRYNVAASHEEHRAYVGDQTILHSVPSSGIWKGYYTQRGEQHAVLEFQLELSNDGTVRGFGVDDVGKFRIQGAHGNRKIAFTKTYDGASLNDVNVRSRSNRGHSVEYRGTCSEDLGAGLLGEWTISSSTGYPEQVGTFRLWPVELSSSAPSSGDVDSSKEVNGDCAVCFEPRRLMRLRPCGHVAFCAECIEQLPRPKKCPLCRTRISSSTLT